MPRGFQFDQPKFEISNPPRGRGILKSRIEQYLLLQIKFFTLQYTSNGRILLTFSKSLYSAVISCSQVYVFLYSQETSVDLDSVTRSLKSFVDKVSSYEGAEFPG